MIGWRACRLVVTRATDRTSDCRNDRSLANPNLRPDSDRVPCLTDITSSFVQCDREDHQMTQLTGAVSTRELVDVAKYVFVLFSLTRPLFASSDLCPAASPSLETAHSLSAYRFLSFFGSLNVRHIGMRPPFQAKPHPACASHHLMSG